MEPYSNKDKIKIYRVFSGPEEPGFSVDDPE
jgi:hypothetical protein